MDSSLSPFVWGVGMFLCFGVLAVTQFRANRDSKMWWLCAIVATLGLVAAVIALWS